MPQNDISIVNSQEFKNFRKDNNLEVIDLEAIAVFLFTLEKKIKEISTHISYTSTDIRTGQQAKESLFDKWYK